MVFDAREDFFLSVIFINDIYLSRGCRKRELGAHAGDYFKFYFNRWASAVELCRDVIF